MILIDLNFETDTEFNYGKTLSMFGNIWICDSTFSLNFMQSKYKSSIFGENSVFNWDGIKCKIHIRFLRFNIKKHENLINDFSDDHMLKW